MGYFDIALVCLNGHVVNDRADASPQFNSKFCSGCGASTITACPACSASIRGFYHVEGVIDLTGGMEEPPNYCHDCGKPFPWTADRIEAAKELVAMSTKLDDKQKAEVIEAIIASSTETARTSIGAERLKKYWSVVGKTAQDVVTSVLSETAKKILLGT